MTKKDYKLIADVINASRTQCLDSVIQGLADKLQEDNPRFNRDKFIAACGGCNCDNGVISSIAQSGMAKGTRVYGPCPLCT